MIFLRRLILSTFCSVLSVLVDRGFDEWATWSPCTATCGLEAVKVRKRECLEEDVCIGSNEMKESCGFDPCPSESILKK